jgi:hypothetical protein
MGVTHRRYRRDELTATMRRWARIVLESFAHVPADIGGGTIPGWHLADSRVPAASAETPSRKRREENHPPG